MMKLGLRRRVGLVLLLGLLLAASAAIAQQPVLGTAAPCERNAIIAPGGATSTLVVCAGIDRSVPELRAQLARLEARLAGRDEETRREVEGLRRALNALAHQLKPADVETLARTLAARLGASDAAPDARLFAELSRLRVDLREVNEKIDGLRGAPATASRTEAELQGGTGTALARLEFAQANSMLDGLARVESKVDAMSRDLRDLAQPAEATAALASDRRIAEDALSRFREAGGQLRCPVLHAELGQVMQASREAEDSARLTVARNLLLTAMSRSMQATAELQNADRLAQSRQDAYQNALSRLEFSIRELDRDITNRQSRIDEDRRRRLADRAQLETHWREQQQRASAEVTTAEEGISRARADLAAAEGMATKTDDEALNKRREVMQRKEVLSLGETLLANAIRQRDLVAQRAMKQLTASPSETISTQLDAEQDRARTAHARTVAARQQAAALASSAQFDEAIEAIRLGGHEANALRRGREAAPLERSTPARVAGFQVCR